MAAPLGNHNAAKGKRWAAAIERAIQAYPAIPESLGSNETMRGINEAAAKFVSLMMVEGDITYFKEFGDRLDGKPTQTIAGDSEQPLSVTATVNFIKPNDP